MLRVTSLVKSYATDAGTVPAVDGISFTIERGQFYTLLGPSGCGKTTALQCIAGLETPDSGEIVMADELVFSSRQGIDLPVHRRNLGMVFQSYAIWPHMTVFENVAFPLVWGHRRTRPEDVRARVMRALSLVKLDGLADRPAPFLSGGQQQRVALARALVHEPQLLLFDEPLSNLDAKLREEMRYELRQLIASLGMTTVYVTHDQVEALAMSDRIALMRNGRIVQEGPPRDVYFRPRDTFVAEFLGGSNIIPGRVVRAAQEGQAAMVDTALGRFACQMEPGLSPGDEATLIVRPEGVRLRCRRADGAGNVIEGGVDAVSFVGGSVETRLRVAGRVFRAKLDPLADIRPGCIICIEVLADRCYAVPSAALS